MNKLCVFSTSTRAFQIVILINEQTATSFHILGSIIPGHTVLLQNFHVVLVTCNNFLMGPYYHNIYNVHLPGQLNAKVGMQSSQWQFWVIRPSYFCSNGCITQVMRYIQRCGNRRVWSRDQCMSMPTCVPIFTAPISVQAGSTVISIIDVVIGINIYQGNENSLK